MSIESVMPSNHLILCRPLLLLPSIFPNIRIFSNESALRIRWPKYQSSVDRRFLTLPHCPSNGTHSSALAWKSQGQRSLVGCRPWGREESDATERLHFHFHALEKEMATHSSVLAWRIPGTEALSGLPSVGLHRVRHD